MSILWAVIGAIVGLVAGTSLRGAVYRLSVPSGDPARTKCQQCSAPVRDYLASRCGGCGKYLGAPLAIEVITAGVLALVLGRFGGQPEVVALAFFAALGVALSIIDVAVQRLPDILTLPAYPVLLILLAGAAVFGHDYAALLRAFLGGLALAGSFLLLAVIRPGQLGGGDVKLAGLAGIALAWIGWPALVFGAALGFLLSAVVSLVLLAARRVKLHSAISFGPFLVGGALLAILVSGR